MKKLVVMMTLALGAGSFGVAYATILGSAHDFSDNISVTGGNVAIDENSATGWNGRKEICRVCHVPHDHARTTQRYLNGLLWNHGVNTTATYTMYNHAWSSTINGVQSAQPDGTAKVCLGCHDGSVGVDTFDKYAGGNVFANSYSGDAQVINFSDGANLDLRGTHPLSIAFPAAADDAGFNSPTVATWASGATVASTLDNGKVQCSTCHDVHNQESVVGTHLLRAAQPVAQGGTASGLCLTCHIK